MSNEEKKALSEVRDFWAKSAHVDRDEQELRPTARDPYLQEVIEVAMEQWLNADASLLDIGCGDGHSTLRFARRVR
ncbi:MAG: hypothetical protein ACREBC_26485, partial [Pyrinomonadaceae bacterium]